MYSSKPSADYCHKRWRYLRDYFVRQLRYHRSTTDPSKLKRPWLLFNKLTFLIPFVAHVVDKNNSDNYSEVTNGCSVDNKPQLQDYLPKFQHENYYECDVSEIHDLAMDLNADTTGGVDEDEINQQSQSHLGFSSNNKKRKFNDHSSCSTDLDSVVHDRKAFEVVKRLDDSLDEHDHFLHSLAPELRKIDSKFNLIFRNEVHNLIIKYQSMSTKD